MFFFFINRVNQVIQTPFICKEIQVLMFPVLVLCTCKRESQRVYTRNVSCYSNLFTVAKLHVLNIKCVGKILHLFLLYMYTVHIQFLESRDDTVLRALASHQCGPGSIPRVGVICGLSLLLVLVFAPRGFSLGSPVFPSPQKPTLLNSNSIWKVSPISALHQIH